MTWFDRSSRREALDKELEAELRFDLDQRVAAKMQGGLDAQQARREARIEFGGVEQIKEECRDVRSGPLDSLFHDVRYALRGMRHSPGFTLVAVLILAVGIGVNATVFSVTNAVLFKGFPLVKRNDRIVYITSGQGCCVSWPDYEDWKAQSRSFVDMALVHGVAVTLTEASGFPERSDVTEVTSNTFALAGQAPAAGRDFNAADEAPGAKPVAILSYGFWVRRFAKDPAVIGRTVRINDVPTSLIGVMPEGFSFPQKTDLWIPLVPTAEVRKRDHRDTWFVFGRLREGISIQTARAEMETIGSRLAEVYPATNGGRNRIPHVLDFRDFFIGPNATLVYDAMWCAVGFVLLIACANLANLMLSRALGRSREISLRIALGAGRWRIARQLLIESMLLAAMGGIAGWWVTRYGVQLLGPSGSAISDATPGDWFNNVLDFSLDYQALAYLAAITLATGLIFGLAPALQLSRLDFNSALKAAGRNATGSARSGRLSALLVACEMALAMVLLAGAGVMIRSFVNLYGPDTGYISSNVLIGLIDLPRARYAEPQDQIAFFERLTERFQSDPGVESVALAGQIPGWNAATAPFETDSLARSEGNSRSADEGRPIAAVLPITSGYFRTLGTTVVSGRDFDQTDRAASVPSVIVNQRFASRYWPGDNPIGKRMRLFKGAIPQQWLSVVGVVPNIVQNDAARQESGLVIYTPFGQRPSGAMWLMARTKVAPLSLAETLRRDVQALDPGLPVALGPMALQDRPAPSYRYRGFTSVLFLIFAVIALGLACIGLYSVMAYTFSRRTQEIGIRMALGASTGDILKLVLRWGMVPVGCGLAAGLVSSLLLNRVLKSFLFHVSTTDPVTLLISAGTLIAAALIGCLLPARRAIAVQPAVALRQE